MVWLKCLLSYKAMFLFSNVGSFWDVLVTLSHTYQLPWLFFGEFRTILGLYKKICILPKRISRDNFEQR